MHLNSLLFVLVIIVICASASQFLQQEWNAWKLKHGKKYQHSEDELFRRKAWEANWEKVQKHNELADQGLKKYRLSMNKFADMTAEDVKSKSCLIPKELPSKTSEVPQMRYRNNVNIPQEVDWRKTKCVTPVKDQGSLCGSCWAFAAVGAIETRLCLKNDELIALSEQQLVDCDTSNHGCCGGFPIDALAYVAKQGVMKSDDYEYTQKKFICEYDPDEAIKLNTTKYYILPGEINMATAVALEGPITVGFGVDIDFFLYLEGIFDGDCAPEANHAIIIEGYGTEKGEDGEDEEYWLIKNSWGEDWGIQGYGKIKRNVNKCDVADMAATIDLIA
ncbi:cathepsin S-like [Pelobates cultripes]|uniref:Cathepsin S-like n=1 Tax=Pelobates cultripes TaxID=61616 RepID=A0AAD1RM87_PELCU|nr:cathepsin S-like [Pelobates cultripes]